MITLKKQEVIGFVHSLSSMIDAGITLPDSLKAIEIKESNVNLKKAINQTRADLEEGFTLSQSFKKLRPSISEFIINMVYAGEQGAGLSSVLSRVVTHLEKEIELKKKIKAVMAKAKAWKCEGTQCLPWRAVGRACHH